MQNYVYLLIKETDTFASFEILCRSVTLRGRLCDAIGTCEKVSNANFKFQAVLKWFNVIGFYQVFL